MWGLNEKARVFIYLGASDMRRGINGLSVLVEHELKGDLAAGDLFVFSNRSRNIIKILYWARSGFCLWQKKLEKDSFKWPTKEEELLGVDQTALEWLLEGLDIDQAHEYLSSPKTV